MKDKLIVREKRKIILLSIAGMISQLERMPLKEEVVIDTGLSMQDIICEYDNLENYFHCEIKGEPGNIEHYIK